MRRCLAVCLSIFLGGCSGFESQPLVETQLLRELNEVTLESLKGTLDQPNKGQPFVVSDGLSSDEAVAVALHLSPGLRAFRREHEVAEGELVAAELLPNPELQASYLFLETFTKSLGTSNLEFGLNWAPPRPGERDAKATRAKARIAEVRALVAAEEWRVAADVRKAFATLVAAQERLNLAEAALALRERIRKYVRDKRALGDANRLDLNFAELEYVESLRERVASTNERDRARQELNRLLGLPPLHELTLQTAADPLAFRAFTLVGRALEPLMLEKRPDLAAAKLEYEQVEQSLRLASIQRIPWIRFGPAMTRDELGGKIQNRWGLSLGLDLPIFNLNEGEIAIQSAKREKLRQQFVDKLHECRAQVAEALRSLRASETLVRLFLEAIRPALEESRLLAETGIEKGEFNLVQLITAQDKVLRSQREFLESRLDYWRAVFELERTLGERFSDKGQE